MKIETYQGKLIDKELIIKNEKVIENVKSLIFVPLEPTKEIAIEYRLKNKEYKSLDWDEIIIPDYYHIQIED